MGNGIFWSEIGSGFGDAGGTPPPKIPRSTPPPGLSFNVEQSILKNCGSLCSESISRRCEVDEPSLKLIINSE